MFIQFLKTLICSHDFKFYRNIHGDEINQVNGKRSESKCLKCGKFRLEDKLNEGQVS